MNLQYATVFSFNLLIDFTHHLYNCRDAASLKMLTVDDMKSLFA
jgi:hypothetical protein